MKNYKFYSPSTAKLKYLFIFILILNITQTSAQETLWNKSGLEITKYLDDGLHLKNYTNNNLKVIVSYKDNDISEYFIRTMSNIEIIFPIEEVYKNYLDSIKLKVHYDFDCYNHDLASLKTIAKKRLEDSRSRKHTIIALKKLFTGFEITSSEGSLPNKIAKKANQSLMLLKAYDDYKNEGAGEAFLNYTKRHVENLFAKKTSKSITGSEKYGSIMSNLKGLHDLMSSDIKYKKYDLEEAAILYSSFIDEEPLYVLHLEFEDGFNRAIDPDNDRITNKDDSCPDEAGFAEYEGCTKESYKRYKRAVRKNNRRDRRYGYPNFMIELNYFITKFNSYNKSIERNYKFSETGFYVNAKLPILRHKFSENIKGSFIANGGLRVGVFNLKAKNKETINLFNEVYADIGISYGLLFPAYSSVRFMLEPMYGRVIHAEVQAGDFAVDGIKVQDDFFIMNNIPKKIEYKGIMTRILFESSKKYFKDIGIDLGIVQYDIIPVVVNPERSTSLSIDDGNQYEYPGKSYNYHFGITYAF